MSDCQVIEEAIMKDCCCQPQGVIELLGVRREHPTVSVPNSLLTLLPLDLATENPRSPNSAQSTGIMGNSG